MKAMPEAFFLLLFLFWESEKKIVRWRFVEISSMLCVGSSAKGEIATYAIQFSGKSHMLYVVEKSPSLYA